MKLRPQPAADGFEAGTHALPDKLDVKEVLLRYQRRAVQAASTAALLVIEKSRRIGLTWGLAFLAVMTAAISRADGGMKVWYMGYDMEMAREFIDVCGMWAKALGFAILHMGEKVLDDEKDIKAFRISFASGLEIVALPSVARAWRGKQGLVLMDEAAFMSDLEEIIKAALALTMWGGRIIIVSTHDGVDNPFNELIDAIRVGKREGEIMKITFDDALADGLYERIKLVVPTSPPKEEWIKGVRDRYGDNAAEELDCIPKTGGGSWLNAGDIAACEHDDAGKPELYQKGPVYIGRDVARRRDGAVIWAFEMVDKVLWLRERWEGVGVTFKEQSEIMAAMMKRYRVVKANIDQTGMGEKVVEDEIALHGSRVEGVLFTGPNRLDLATTLRDRFEAGTIRIPSDSAIRVDLRALKRASRKNKALAEGDTHPDMFWAAALAADAASLAEQFYEYTGASSLRKTANDDDDGYGRRRDDDDGTTRHGVSRGGGAW